MRSISTLVCCITLIAILLAGCGSSDPTPTPTATPLPTFTPIPAPTASPTPSPFQVWTPEDVVAALQVAGLEVVDVRPMVRDDYGMAPMLDVSSLRFMLPSLGESKGARILSYANQQDLDAARNFFEGLKRASALLYVHVFVRDNIILQLNGDLPDERAAEYEKALMAMSK